MILEKGVNVLRYANCFLDDGADCFSMVESLLASAGSNRSYGFFRGETSSSPPLPEISMCPR